MVPSLHLRLRPRQEHPTLIYGKVFFFFFTWITCHQMEIINPADYMDWGFPYPDCLSGGKMNFPEGFLPRILFGDAVRTTQYVVHQWANPSLSVWGEFKWGLEVFLVQCNETISSQYHWCDIWYMHTNPPSPPPQGIHIQLTFFCCCCRLPFLWWYYGTLMISVRPWYCLFRDVLDYVNRF